MLDNNLKPEFERKLKFIADKIRSTNFDKGTIELYFASIIAVLEKYLPVWEYDEFVEKLKAIAEEGDPAKFELALEMVENVYL